MTNAFDYMRWRGDLTFAQAPFSEVDALVMSRFAYFPLDDIVPEAWDESYSIAKAWAAFLSKYPGDARAGDAPF